MTEKVKLNNGTIVEIREPKVRDMKIAESFDNPVDQELNLIANLTGLTIDEIDELSMKEYSLIQKSLSSFL